MFQEPSRRLLATPENLPPSNDYVCRRLKIPRDTQWLILVNGVLSLLCDDRNFEYTPGGVSLEDTTEIYRQMWLEYCESDDFCMIGAIVPVVTASVPSNMLLCDGATYLRTDYPDLYAALDSAFVVDADHFIVPDLRARTVIGSNGDYPVNASGGEATHTLTTAEMPEHTHTIGPHNHGVTDPGHTHTQVAHNHGVTDPGHTHTQVAHNHGVTDPGHTHNVATKQTSTAGTATQVMEGSATGAINSRATVSNTTGITTNNATPTNNSNTTGLTVNNATPTNNSNTTGITINLAGLGPENTGGGGAHNNMQPYRALKYAVIAR